MIFQNKMNCIKIGWAYPCWCVYAALFGSRLSQGMHSWLRDALSQLIQGIYVIALLLFDQYVTVVKGLHVESFPTIHFCSLIAWFQ